MLKEHNRRKRPNDVVVTWSRFFWCTVFVVLTCVLFSGFTFSTFRLLFGETVQPVLVLKWRARPVKSLSGESPREVSSITVRGVVSLPDQSLVFLNYPSSSRLFAKEDLACVYHSVAKNSTTAKRKFRKSPISSEGIGGGQIVRCPLQPRGFVVSVGLKRRGKGETFSGETASPSPPKRWDSLAYEALIDRDNTTVVFVKGLNLRPERVSDASKFECVYGWDFAAAPKFVLRSEVVSIAQEIVRCKTPLSLLSGGSGPHGDGINSVKVSVRMKGRKSLNTIARPRTRTRTRPTPATRKDHEVCVCTMVRNQARFLKEWVMYHAEIGVERWFVYDNNSNDGLEAVVGSLSGGNYNVTRHAWPWVKTQEAGFAHCALRARGACEWVGFIDVDEFIHLPRELVLKDVVANQTSHDPNVAELRVSCHSFGPSGLKRVPARGVTVGYTCRLAAPERHKSVVRPEALNASLINVVHHFHLREGFGYVNVDRNVMVINHYKYQVWEVFKDKFYRRVATYVADWQDDQNVGSKDRAPGLGTRAVEPPDWSTRFCEVNDFGLRDRVLQRFSDTQTHLLPWQNGFNGHDMKHRKGTAKMVRKRKGIL